MVLLVGKELGKLQWEVEQLTPDELAEWLALFEIQHEQREKALKEAQAKARVGRGRR